MRLQQQIDLYEVHEWSCHQDGLDYKKLVDQERCYDFLLDLNDAIEDVQGCIMTTKPLPSLEESFNMIKCEESRKVLTHSPIPSNSSHDSSTLAI